MKVSAGFILLVILSFQLSCRENQQEKAVRIQQEIQLALDKGVEATRTKDIEVYMENLPADLIIYDETGELISREQQKEYALRDWAIIDTTLRIKVVIDSLNTTSEDGVIVYTSQMWERMMFRRDGITTDTVLTTQKHKEIWRKNPGGWQGYEIEELGGKIFINGTEYHQ